MTKATVKELRAEIRDILNDEDGCCPRVKDMFYHYSTMKKSELEAALAQYYEYINAKLDAEEQAQEQAQPADNTQYTFAEILDMDDETFTRVFADYQPCSDALDLVAVLNEEIDAEMSYNSTKLLNRKVIDFMPPVTRLGDSCTGHGDWPPRPSTSASPDVFANSIPVHRQGDSWAVHCNSIPVCHGGSLASGSSTVFANGRQLGRIGDPVDCGSSVAAGSPDVFAGG